MYRIEIQIQILLLLQGSRDELCPVHLYRSSQRCMNAFLFVPFSFIAIPFIMFLFGISLAGKVVGWFEEYSSAFKKKIFFDISHCIAPCHISMNHCVQYIELSSGTSKQINSLPTHHLKYYFPVQPSKLQAVPVQHLKLRQCTINTC